MTQAQHEDRDYKFYLEAPDWIIPDELNIYRRADHKVPRWQGRSIIKNKKPVSFSTKKLIKADAIKVAIQRHMEMKTQATMGLQPRAQKKTWKAVWEEFDTKVLGMKVERETISAKRRLGQQGLYKNWMDPYWGKKHIVPITEKEMQDYWHWAMSKGVASNDYLLTISKAVSAIIKYAYSRQYVLGVPPILLPPVKKEDIRRGAYTRDQIEKVIEPHLKKWKDKGNKNSSTMARLVYYNYVLFSVYSGIRIGTILKLKWENIELPDLTVTEDGRTIIKEGDRTLEFNKMEWLDYIAKKKNIDMFDITYINVMRTVGKNKGSYLQVVPMRRLTKILQDYKKQTFYNKDTDFVFPNFDGTQRKTDSIEKFHRNVIHKLGDDFKKDKFGLDLTPYSWRHTYATWMLIHTDTSNERIVSNMDTSLKHLKDHYGHTTNRDFAIDLAGEREI